MCVCACVCLCLCEWLSVCVCEWMCVCVYVCVWASRNKTLTAHLYVRTPTRIYTQSLQVSCCCCICFFHDMDRCWWFVATLTRGDFWRLMSTNESFCSNRCCSAHFIVVFAYILLSCSAYCSLGWLAPLIVVLLELALTYSHWLKAWLIWLDLTWLVGIVAFNRLIACCRTVVAVVISKPFLEKSYWLIFNLNSFIFLYAFIPSLVLYRIVPYRIVPYCITP